jgi:hypothetical protein
MSRNLLPQMGKRRKISTDFGRNASESGGRCPGVPAMCNAELNSYETNGRGWPLSRRGECVPFVRDAPEPRC